MTLYAVAIGLVLGAVCNRVRGGFLTQTGGAAIAAGVLGAIVFWFSWNWIAAVAVAVAYLVGESFGWSKWFNVSGHLTQTKYNEKWAWPKDKTGKEGPHYLAKIFVDETRNYKNFCFLGFMFRGIYWWTPVLAVLWWFGLVGPAWAVAAVAVLALTFPMAYKLGYKTQFVDGRGGKYLASAEVIYGALYGAVLGFILG